MFEIGHSLSKDGNIPDNWKDISTLIDNDHKKEPVILYTYIRTKDWNNHLFMELVSIQNHITRPSGYPIILCILLTYHEKYKRRKQKIIKQLKKSYKDIEIPILSDIDSDDLNEWQSLSLTFNNKKKRVKEIFKLEPYEINQILEKGSLPMDELAKRLKLCFEQEGEDNT